MKKLFTLFVLLTCVLGAKAEWVEDYKVDYSTYSGFPFYVMGFVPEWVDGVMTDMGGNFEYVKTDNEEGKSSDVIVTTNDGTEYYRIEKEGTWHQYFIADGIRTELDGSYTVKAMVKASEACTVPVNFQWGWGEGQRVSSSLNVGTEWAEVEMEVSGIGGTSCALIAQPNTAAIIEWKYVIVGHNAKPQKPITWLEQLENGNAEKTWAEMGLADIRFDDMENNMKICAWAKQKGTNVNDDGASDPFPANIEEVDGSKVFVVHGAVADTEGDASKWDNQFWIQSKQPWKEGTQIKISFRYKASKACKTATQMHNQKPSDYKIWYAIGDVNFTTEWQNFEKIITIDANQANAWSIAFNLNEEVKEAVDFYFDDLSWQTMKLDEGYFVAGANAAEGLDYDLDNAIEFVENEEGVLEATVGEKGAYVSQVMISTIRGNDAAFKGATLKPAGAIVNDPDTWLNYAPASLAKLTLPGAGIWKIYIDTEYNSMAFEMIEGTIIEPIEINPNPTVVVVKGQERDWLVADQDGNAREEEIGTGNEWDNQLFIHANRALTAGEVTVVEFDYVATVEAKTNTQCGIDPIGTYKHWSCIGDVDFTTEEQHFSKEYTVPAEADGMTSIQFQMAVIKGACDYTIKNIVWKLADGTESLIDQTGTNNFYVKEGAGTAPYQFGTDPSGINSVSNDNVVSGKAYNLAGQAVSKNFKGIVVKDGKKYVVE